ncbi:glycosyltransferase family 39 protein [Candidatus Ruminimicrobiellum ovillum]|uniref:glycosyltransferase family 39 protein n=1 Tax=Candidatus Ruminimicrobiellum ovillum TaxID=1947927 RepID=UPI0035598E98
MSYYYKLFWILTTITTFLRLSVIGKLGLTVDEAHYWVYSKFLDLSYYDHPPMIGYIIKLFTDIFGINEFAVRLPSVIIFVITSWLFFLCIKKLFNERVAFIGIVLINILPVFSFLGAVVTIPDSPLSLFWILSFYLFINIIETKEKKYWYILGLVVGLAFLAKYTAVMIYPSIILFLICSKENRFWFLKKEPYLAMIISFIIFLPVVVWNIQNNWASFGFQLQHGFGKSLPSFSFTLFGRSIGAQAGYVSPFLFIFFCYVAYVLIKDAFFKKQKDALFVASFSLPVLFFFNAIATFNEILPHWPAMGYLILTIYAAYIINKFWDNSKFRKIIYFSCGFALFLDLIVPVHCIYKFIPIEPFLPKKETQKVEYGIPKAEIVDVSNDLYGWKELSSEINKVYDSYPEDKKPFLFTHKSYLASQIYFYTPDIRVYCLSGKIDAYDLWQRDISALKNKDGLFITSNMFDFKNPEKIYPFAEFEQPIEVPVYRNNKLVKKFWITKCKNFNPDLLPEKYTANIIGQKKSLMQGLIDTDHRLFKFINIDVKNKFFDFIISNVSFYDDKGVNPSVIVIVLVTLIILRKEEKNKFWILLAFIICTVIVASTLNTFIKGFLDRPRPLAVFGEGNINIFYEVLHARSFPSGHTQFAFTVMTTMLLLIPKYWYIYLTLAFATGFERIYAGCHFPIDVCCGALEGIIISYIMVKLFKKIYKL